MTSLTHHYSNASASKKHDEIVGSLAEIFKKYPITYPDAENHIDGHKNPDLAINDNLVIEVKVLNPTVADYQIDQAAQAEWESKKSANYGGTMNPKPIQRDIERAIKQLENRQEIYKLLVLYSPLIWQLKHSRLADMLTGLHTLQLYSRNGEVIASRSYKSSVPIKRGTEEKIDGILYLNEALFENRKLWMLNDKTNPLLNELCKDIESFWSNEE